MATPQENLSRFQEIHNRGIQDKLDPMKRERFDEALKRGLIKDERNVFSRTFSPQKEDFGEIGVNFRGLKPEQVLAAAKGEGVGNFELPHMDSPDPNASLGSDKYGNQTIIVNGEQLYLNKPGFTMRDIPGAIKKADETAHDVAPFLAAGGVTSAIGAGKAMVTQAVTGLATEGIDQTTNALKGNDIDYERLAATPALAAIGEGGARFMFMALKPVFTKILGKKLDFDLIKEDGSLSDDAISALKNSEIPASEVDELLKKNLQEQGALTAEEAERFNFFKSQGLTPTRAQVTRTADDFQLQQEAAKTSTSVRDALEEQEAYIAQAFDTRIRGTNGNASSSGSPISDAILNKASALDDEISRLYSEASSSAPAGNAIRLRRFVEKVELSGSSNKITNGLIKSVRGFLRDLGVSSTKTSVVGSQGSITPIRTVSGVSVNTAESVRRFLNSHYESTTPFGRSFIRDLKNLLDEDVLKASGDDLFSRARAAKAEFEDGLNVNRISKFDTNKKSLVRDVLENKIKPDDLFNRAVIGKTWKANDLQEVKDYLTKGSQDQIMSGSQAWNDLRAETVQWIKEASSVGAENGDGIMQITRDKLEKAVNRIGKERLEVLFSPEERNFIDSMIKLVKLREPVTGTGSGLGPSAQAFSHLYDQLKRTSNNFPVVGNLIESVRNTFSGKAALSTTQSTERAFENARSVANRRVVTTPASSVSTELGDK